jgi:hypothetical protein
MIYGIKSEKRAVFGDPLTWIPALIIIIILMVLLVVVGGILILKKGLSSDVVNSDIQISESQHTFFKILNTPASEGKTIKDLLVEWQINKDGKSRDLFEGKLKDALAGLKQKENICAEFSIYGADGDKIQATSFNNADYVVNSAESALISGGYVPNSASSEYILVLDNKQVKIDYVYKEKC